MHDHQPHPVTPGSVAAFSDSFLAKKGKRRGNYNCGRCGQPKKGHVCHLPPPLATDSSTDAVTPADSSTSSATMAVVTATPLCVARSVPRQKPYSNIRRTLFDDVDVFLVV
jgi:5-methylcytosine-specific restriction endonuclease McrA